MMQLHAVVSNLRCPPDQFQLDAPPKIELRQGFHQYMPVEN